MKKNKAVLAIEKLHAAVTSLVEFIPTLDDDHIQYKIEQTMKMDSDVVMELKKRNGDIHFKNLINSMKKANLCKATYHANKLKNAIRYVRDDFPPDKGQEVSIKRYEHGWLDGAWSGKIKEVHGQPGSKRSYTVTVDEEYGNACQHFDIHIDHTRDLYY